MKTFTLKFSSFAFVLLLVTSATLLTSCKKDKTTYGKVTVVTEAKAPVLDATVTLSAPSANGEKSFTQKTNASGVTDFEIDLPGIWDVNVVTSDSLLTGTGVLRIDEPGKKDEITVIVR